MNGWLWKREWEGEIGGWGILFLLRLQNGLRSIFVRQPRIIGAVVLAMERNFTASFSKRSRSQRQFLATSKRKPDQPLAKSKQTPAPTFPPKRATQTHRLCPLRRKHLPPPFFPCPYKNAPIRKIKRRATAAGFSKRNPFPILFHATSNDPRATPIRYLLAFSRREGSVFQTVAGS